MSVTYAVWVGVFLDLCWIPESDSANPWDLNDSQLRTVPGQETLMWSLAVIVVLSPVMFQLLQSSEVYQLVSWLRSQNSCVWFYAAFRLSFTMDGNLLIVPSGSLNRKKGGDVEQVRHFIESRNRTSCVCVPVIQFRSIPHMCFRDRVFLSLLRSCRASSSPLLSFGLVLSSLRCMNLTWTVRASLLLCCLLSFMLLFPFQARLLIYLIVIFLLSLLPILLSCTIHKR